MRWGEKTFILSLTIHFPNSDYWFLNTYLNIYLSIYYLSIYLLSGYFILSDIVSRYFPHSPSKYAPKVLFRSIVISVTNKYTIIIKADCQALILRSRNNLCE